MARDIASALKAIGKKLARRIDALTFSPPVTHVYNPLAYAWQPYAQYVDRYGSTTKNILFLGMNPGPWGMAQTGIPFGDPVMVRDWIGTIAKVGRPSIMHPKKPVEGFLCPRSEVSGTRLWGLFRERFGEPERFFARHFVENYCPLIFLEESGKNRTPDKLPAREGRELTEACNEALRGKVDVLEPQWVIGIGAYAERQALSALRGMDVKIGKVLHPSPASPAANRGWGPQAIRQLVEQGVWA